MARPVVSMWPVPVPHPSLPSSRPLIVPSHGAGRRGPRGAGRSHTHTHSRPGQIPGAPAPLLPDHVSLPRLPVGASLSLACPSSSSSVRSRRHRGPSDDPSLSHIPVPRGPPSSVPAAATFFMRGERRPSRKGHFLRGPPTLAVSLAHALLIKAQRPFARRGEEKCTTRELAGGSGSL